MGTVSYTHLECYNLEENVWLQEKASVIASGHDRWGDVYKRQAVLSMLAAVIFWFLWGGRVEAAMPEDVLTEEESSMTQEELECEKYYDLSLIHI